MLFASTVRNWTKIGKCRGTKLQCMGKLFEFVIPLFTRGVGGGELLLPPFPTPSTSPEGTEDWGGELLFFGVARMKVEGDPFCMHRGTLEGK